MEFVRQNWLVLVEIAGVLIAVFVVLRMFAARNWSGIFVAFLVCLGLIGGAAMSYFAPGVPTPIVALFLAIGTAAAAHRFLGGIPVGPLWAQQTLQLSGSVGALVLFFNLLNGAMTTETHLTRSDLVGRWHWQWAGGGWDGSLDFQMVGGALTVKGVMVDVKDPQHPILSFDNGTAELQADGTLKLAVDVTDHRFNQAKYRWVTLKPLLVGHVYSGTLNVDPADPMYSVMAHNNWGIEMTRPR